MNYALNRCKFKQEEKVTVVALMLDCAMRIITKKWN
jgi:hypothetical protein